MRIALALAALAAAWSGASAALASECEQTPLRVESGRVVLEYDPFANDDPEVPVALFAPDGLCDGVSISVSGLGALRPAGRGLAFPEGLRIELNDSSRRSVVSEGGGGSALRGDAAARAPGTITGALSLMARRGQALAPGAYLAEATLRTATRRGGVAGEERFEIEVRVQPSFRLGASTLIANFGELTPGAQQVLTLSAFANTRYQLELVSDFGWRLLPMAVRGDPGVPYALTIDGATVATNGPNAVVTRAAPRRGLDVLQFAVTVGEITDRPAGDYRDYITVSIAPGV